MVSHTKHFQLTDTYGQYEFELNLLRSFIHVSSRCVDAYDKYTCHMKIICWFDQHVRFFSSDVIRSRATNRNSINHNALYTTIATTTTTTTRTTTTTTTTTITIMFDNNTQTTKSTIIGYYLCCCFWMKWFDLRSHVLLCVTT